MFSVIITFVKANVIKLTKKIFLQFQQKLSPQRYAGPSVSFT